MSFDEDLAQEAKIKRERKKLLQEAQERLNKRKLAVRRAIENRKIDKELGLY